MSEKIKGGYVLLARSIDDSEIANAAPSVREMWVWLVRQAYYKDEIVCGRQFKRGQCFINYQDIMDGLKWFVGFRKMTYKKHHCENSMKWLTKAGMITTTKTARGMVVTICNYDTYQSFENYENYKKAESDATGSQRQSDSKDNEVKCNNTESNNTMSDSTNQTLVGFENGKNTNQTIASLFGESDSTGGQPKKVKHPKEQIENYFDECWDLWPRKVSKIPSEKSFKVKIINNPKRPSKEFIISKIKAYAAYMQTATHNPLHFSTWLNNERWNDELGGNAQIAIPQNPQQGTRMQSKLGNQ